MTNREDKMDANRINLADFQQLLTRKNLLPIQIIQLGITAGCTVFLVVVLVLTGKRSVGAVGAGENAFPIDILTLIHLGLALTAYAAAIGMYRFLVNPKRLAGSMYLANQPDHAAIAEKCLSLIRTGTILRFAFLEGVAFFGLILCLLAGQNGLLEAHPEYWLNVFSYLVLLLVTLATFATRDRVENLFINRFLNAYLYRE